MSTLDAKIRKLKSAIPGAEKPTPRVLRLVANNREEADELARANGFHPGDEGHDEIMLVVITSCVPKAEAAEIVKRKSVSAILFSIRQQRAVGENVPRAQLAALQQ